MMQNVVRPVFGRLTVAMLMVIKVSFTAAIRVCCVSLIASGLLGVGLARERGPRVEVTCPSPPIPVSIEKRKPDVAIALLRGGYTSVDARVTTVKLSVTRVLLVQELDMCSA